MSIPKIVERFGWRRFRELEFEVCQKAASAANQASVDGEWLIIDAGGGVVVDLDEESGNEVYSQRKVRFCCSHLSPQGKKNNHFCQKIGNTSRKPKKKKLIHPHFLSASQVDALKRAGSGGKVVFLKRDIKYLLNRINGDTNRPSLSDQSTFQEIMERREPWYHAAADHVLDATVGPMMRKLNSSVDP